MDKFRRADGSCTLYALACGHLDAHRVGGDPQAITMGAEGAVYFVKSRVHTDPQQGREGMALWLTYDRDAEGYREARRMFRMLRRSVSDNPPAKPDGYRDSNPKIDLWILCKDGRTVKYIGSTNYWRTCRDALAYYNATQPLCYVRASIDRSAR